MGKATDLDDFKNRFAGGQSYQNLVFLKRSFTFELGVGNIILESCNALRWEQTKEGIFPFPAFKHIRDLKECLMITLRNKMLDLDGPCFDLSTIIHFSSCFQ